MAKTRSSLWALRHGQKLARAGKLAESLAAFNAFPGEPADFRLLIHHALTLARAGQADAALEKSSKAAQTAPADAVPALFNAYLLLRFSRIGEAEAELKRAEELSHGGSTSSGSANPIVPSLRAALDILGDKPADGCRKLLEGPVTDNLEILGWLLALIERKVFEAVGTNSGAIPPKPEKEPAPEKAPADASNLSADTCAKRGQRLLESGKPAAAVKYLEQAAKSRPDNADNRAVYGAALFEAGEFERAEAELSQTPEKGSLTGVAQFYRAANSYRLGRYEAAIELLDTLPKTGDVVLYREWRDYVRGMALVALGRTAEAADCLAVFINAEPELLRRRLNVAVEVLAEKRPCSTSS